MSFLTGPFSATYGAKPLGVVDGGFEHIWQALFEDIRVDSYKGLLNGVFTGIDMTIRTILTELDWGLSGNTSAVRDMIWPFDATVQADLGKVTTTGVLMSTFARPLVLTPCPGTLAASRGSTTGGTLATITFPLVVISADPVSIKYANEWRKCPVTLIVLPNEASSSGSGLITASSPCGPKTYFTLA